MFPTDAYMYSYTLLGNGVSGNVNRGLGQMSGVPFKLTSVRNPAEKLMLVEEPASSDPSDMPIPGSTKIVDDGRWEPKNDGSGNLLTRRHNAKATVNFADGHARPVPWQFGTNDLHIDPLF